VYFGKINSVEECLAGCRLLEPHGYSFAGLEYKTECYCGEEPDSGFGSHFTWPERCNMRCEADDAFWQNCGGAGAMNLWSVPPSPDLDLEGICVYDHPKDGRVFDRYSENGVQDLTIDKCKNDCFDKGLGLPFFFTLQTINSIFRLLFSSKHILNRCIRLSILRRSRW